MSVQAIAYVLEHSEAEHACRLVLLSMANHTNDEWVASASVATYMKETRLGERTVQTAIKQLVTDKRIRSRGTHPKYRTNSYELVRQVADAESAPPADIAGAGPAGGRSIEADSAPEPKASRGLTSSNPPAHRSDPWARSFEALAIAGGKNPRNLTPAEARVVGIKLGEIRKAEAALANRELEDGQLAGEICLRAERYRRDNPTWPRITVPALAMHWSELGAKIPGPRLVDSLEWAPCSVCGVETRAGQLDRGGRCATCAARPAEVSA